MIDTFEVPAPWFASRRKFGRMALKTVGFVLHVFFFKKSFWGEWMVVAAKRSRE